MTFLPMAQRELREAARRRSTYRVRWWTTLIAMALTLLGLGVVSVSRGPRGAGGTLFDVLTGYAFFLCLLFGVLLTADALARERREGTLGLLFLADLKGYDIVLGKFMARSLNVFYALLAMLPAAALPLLLGGLEGTEFFRMSLTLVNALCVSAAAGMFVSSLSRESQSALSNGVALVLLLAAILPLVATGLRAMGSAPSWQALGWLSPFYAYSHSRASSYVGREGVFWGALAASHLFGWLMLAGASLVLPRVFQEAPRPARLPAKSRGVKAGVRRSRAHRDWLEKSPVLWLRGSELGIPWTAWAVVGCWGIAAVGILFFEWTSGPTGGQGPTALQVESARVAGFFLKLLFAFAVCRFFVDARRDGTLELLLCTPLLSREIIHEQMKAVWRTYRWPFFMLMILLFTPVLLRVALGLVQPQESPFHGAAASIFLAGGFALRTGADIIAILWFGTGLALAGRRPHLASVSTVLFVLILPAPLGFCWVDVLVDLCLISWGTNKCRLDLRRLVAEQYQVYSQRRLPLSHAAGIA